MEAVSVSSTRVALSVGANSGFSLALSLGAALGVDYGWGGL